MLTSVLAERIPLPSSLLRPPTSEPSPSTLFAMEERFVKSRDVIHMSRTPSGDIAKTIPETYEAIAELEGKVSRKRLQQSFSEEVADTFIYLSSTAASLGVLPNEVDEGLQQRLEQRPIPKAPLRRQARLQFHQDGLAVLQARLYDTQAYIADSLQSDPLTGRDTKAIQKVLDAMHQAWIVGKSERNDFGRVVASKIRKNEARFTEREFRRRPGEHYTVTNAIAYTRQKVREGKWPISDALEKLQDNPAIIEHGIIVDVSFFDNL